MTKTEGVFAALSERLIRVLPPAMLVLVLLNVAFLAVATYVFGHNTEVRNELLSKIVDRCLKATP
jgi:hypothetical protein